MHHEDNAYSNDFGLTFRCSKCVGHFQCPNDFCDYLHCNVGVRNFGERVGSTLLPFHVGSVTPKKSRLECKVCHSTPIYIDVCNGRIVYVHSITHGMYRTYIYLGVHDRHVSNNTC